MWLSRRSARRWRLRKSCSASVCSSAIDGMSACRRLERYSSSRLDEYWWLPATSVILPGSSAIRSAASCASGVIPTVGPYILPEIGPALAQMFPDLILLWSEERTNVLVHELHDGDLDGAIVALEADIGDCEHAVLGRDAFVLAAAPNHPLVTSTTAATLQELDGAAVLLLDDGHCFREQVLNLCTQARAEQMSFRATSLSTLVQMASAGTGVTLLPALALPVENRRSQLRVRAFAPPGPARTLALAWRRGSALRMPLNRVAETIRAALE